MAEGYKHMLAWLEGDSDRKSDVDVWSTTKSRYSIANMGEWLKKQKGKKTVKPVMRSTVWERKSERFRVRAG